LSATGKKAILHLRPVVNVIHFFFVTDEEAQQAFATDLGLIFVGMLLYAAIAICNSVEEIISI